MVVVKILGQEVCFRCRKVLFIQVQRQEAREFRDIVAFPSALRSCQHSGRLQDVVNAHQRQERTAYGTVGASDKGTLLLTYGKGALIHSSGLPCFLVNKLF